MFSSLFSSSGDNDDIDDKDNPGGRNSMSKYDAVRKEVFSHNELYDADTSEVAGEVVVAAATSTSTNTAASSSSPSSWTEAHHTFCIKHGVFKATPQQVINATFQNDDDIPWDLPSKKCSSGVVLTDINEVTNHLRTQRGTMMTRNGNDNNTSTSTTTPVKPSLMTRAIMSPIKVATYVGNVGKSLINSISNDDEYDDDEWKQDGDDAYRADNDNDDGYTGNSLSSSGFNLTTTLIFDPVLIESTIQPLENAIGSSRSSADTPYIVMGLLEWNAWTMKILQSGDHKFDSLSHDDNHLLLQILVRLDKARIYKRQKQSELDDVIVLSSTIMTTTASSSNTETASSDDDSIPDHLRTIITLWDIQNAKERNQKKLEGWSGRVDAYSNKAKQYKKQNQMNLALNQMKLRKIYETRIDALTNQQLNLENIESAIESSKTNQEMMNLMTESTQVLRTIRGEIPIEEIDDAVDDFQAELVESKLVNETLGAIGTNSLTIDEDELLEELNGLSLQDNNRIVVEEQQEHEMMIDERKHNYDDTNTASVKSRGVEGIVLDSTLSKNDTEQKIPEMA